MSVVLQPRRAQSHKQACNVTLQNSVLLTYIFRFLDLASQLPKCTKTSVKSDRIAYEIPKDHLNYGWGSTPDQAVRAYNALPGPPRPFGDPRPMCLSLDTPLLQHC